MVGQQRTVKYDRTDHALINLGRVHAYTTFLEKQGFLAAGSVAEFCRRFYDHRKELKHLAYEEALEEALNRREAQRRKANGR